MNKKYVIYWYKKDAESPEGYRIEYLKKVWGVTDNIEEAELYSEREAKDMIITNNSYIYWSYKE